LVAGPTTEELAEIKALRKEVADQQRTIEILKAATTYVGDRCQEEVRSQPAA
jgi:transposase-like protein